MSDSDGDEAEIEAGTRARLIKATLELIAEKGPEALRTREILDRAAVSNLSAISYHFGSLENLRMTAIRRYMSGMRKAFSDLDEEADPREALLGMLRSASRFILDHPSLERNIVFLLLSEEGPDPYFSGVLKENLGAFSSVILRAKKKKSREEADMTAIALASAVIYPMLLSQYGAGPLGMDAEDEGLRERYFVNLVEARAGPRRPQ